ncbi:MAG TPA: crotonase/enoyl-CoA hydratase family protein [Frankiaceae bacterium]|nr:crotonase/enoyl-CoA hydratase family protein [Frankiaceae bacterium]
MSVRVDREGTTTVVTIDRPDVRNAVDGPTAAALLAAFEEFDADDSQRVAVLTGAGGTFCAGADLRALTAGVPMALDENGPGPMGPTRLEVSKPTIAAVEGYAVAGGLELALWCDLRVAAEDAVFGVYCRRWGVPLMDGGTVRLPRLIGQSRALDLVLTGRGVSGAEAVAFGLVNRSVPAGTALDAALALAADVAAFPQFCVRSDRASLYASWDLPLAAALSQEHRYAMATLASGETLAGAARFVEGAGRHGGPAQ